jgi:hypothetical protein
MKTRILTSTILAVFFAFGIGVGTQRMLANQTQQEQATPGQSNSGMMGGGMAGQGMEPGHGMMGQMHTHHQQMTALMKKLMQSMAAIQSEKDPQVLKSKLAEHQKLLNEMRGQMMHQDNMMQMMSGQGMQSCPGMADSSKPPAK